MSKFRITAVLIVGIIGFFVHGPATASTPEYAMSVSATVDAVCTVQTPYGNVTGYPGALSDQLLSVSVNCSDGTPYAIAFGNDRSAVTVSPSAITVTKIASGAPQTSMTRGVPLSDFSRNLVVVTLTY